MSDWVLKICHDELITYDPFERNLMLFNDLRSLSSIDQVIDVLEANKLWVSLILSILLRGLPSFCLRGETGQVHSSLGTYNRICNADLGLTLSKKNNR
jgi:hypothetical protein